MDGNAIILTGGLLTGPAAKTAHGLIRGTDRYKILGVIDDAAAGNEAGNLIDGKDRNIPIYPNLDQFLQESSESAQFCLIGIATAGGRMPQELLPSIRKAIQAGMSIVSGLHEFLSDKAEFQELAQKHGVKLIDVRKPKSRSELSFWDGSIFEVKCPKIAVLGMDCAVGKRTTARFLTEELQKQGHVAEMIFTGQTGWMQGGRYGFIFDSTLNDFVSGELEKAIVSCYRDLNPDFIIVEGQAAMRNPSGPCGPEFLVSGRMDGVILQCAPARTYYKGWEEFSLKIPSLADEIALIKMYGVPTLGISINTKGLTEDQARAYQKQFQDELGLPVVLPVEDGVSELLAPIQKLIQS